MKKVLSLILVVFMLVGVTACSDTPQTGTAESSNETNSTQSQIETDDTTDANESIATDTSSESTTDDSGINDTKILIAYFSRADENYGLGYIEKGNTCIIAEMIAEEVGGTLFEIERVTPYPADYDECTDEAKQEQNNNARPALTATVDNFDEYDIIYLGYPNWWGDMPMPVYTFLESYDFSGKTVIPFCTHAGSGLSSTVRSITNECEGATVLEGLAITGTTAQNNQDSARESVISWLEKLGMID